MILNDFESDELRTTVNIEAIGAWLDANMGWCFADVISKDDRRTLMLMGSVALMHEGRWVLVSEYVLQDMGLQVDCTILAQDPVSYWPRVSSVYPDRIIRCVKVENKGTRVEHYIDAVRVLVLPEALRHAGEIFIPQHYSSVDRYAYPDPRVKREVVQSWIDVAREIDETGAMFTEDATMNDTTESDAIPMSIDVAQSVQLVGKMLVWSSKGEPTILDANEIETLGIEPEALLTGDTNNPLNKTLETIAALFKGYSVSLSSQSIDGTISASFGVYATETELIKLREGEQLKVARDATYVPQVFPAFTVSKLTNDFTPMGLVKFLDDPTDPRIRQNYIDLKHAYLVNMNEQIKASMNAIKSQGSAMADLGDDIRERIRTNYKEFQ